jgi:hypothetical protein
LRDFREAWPSNILVASQPPVTPLANGRLRAQEDCAMAMNSNDVMEDLAYGEAEGAADLWGEDDADMYEDDFETDLYEDEYEDDLEDEFEDDFETEDEEEADEFIGKLLGSALGAEDEDEFLGKLFSGAKKLISKAAPVLGKIARGAAPILSMIPHPAAQIGSQVAKTLGKLRAEGASVEDALEAVAEIAVRDPRALPVVSGLAARSVIKSRGAQMSPVQRKKIAKTVQRAATTLVKQGGPKAIRALPKITRSVKRTAAAKGTPVSARPTVLAKTASKVAQNPTMLRRLSTPSARGQSLARRTASVPGGGYSQGSRTINIPGPATIRISLG